MKHMLSVPGIARNFQLMALVAFASLLAACEKSVVSEDLRSGTEMLRRSPAPGAMTITQIAAGNPNFSELVKALSYADEELGTSLVALFNGKDQYTVFAPTNAAFQKLYDLLGVQDITGIDPNLVLSVLQYHVTEGRRAANSVLPSQGTRKIETLLPGASFAVYPNGMIKATGNSANITTADVSASNGIIHVIDAVILPI